MKKTKIKKLDPQITKYICNEHNGNCKECPLSLKYLDNKCYYLVKTLMKSKGDQEIVY